ncbi:MAG: DUF6745 domain-containing protein, partial [Terriglobales bacterium]
MINKTDEEKLIELLRNHDLVEKYHREWMPPLAKSLDKKAVEAGFHELYELSGHRKPLIIWCESPWQIAVAPYLLDVMSKCNWRQQLTEKLTVPLWAQCFKRLSEQVSPAAAHRLSESGAGSPLVNGSQGLWTRLLLKLDQNLRRTIGHKTIDAAIYTCLRSRIFPEGSRMLPADLHGPLLQPQVRTNLLGLTGTEPRIVRVGHELIWEAEAALTGRAGSDETLGSEFSDQIGTESAIFLYKKFLPSYMAGEVENETAAVTEVGYRAAEYIGGAVASMSWRVPDDPWLRVYAFPFKYMPESEPVEASIRIIETWRSLLRYDIMFVLYGPACFICPAPVRVELDGSNRLHSDSRPAVAFEDGFKLYSWHGVSVPEYVIMHPELLNAQHIDDERNIEVRRAMLERYGEAKYLEDSGA